MTDSSEHSGSSGGRKNSLVVMPDTWDARHSEMLAPRVPLPPPEPETGSQWLKLAAGGVLVGIILVAGALAWRFSQGRPAGGDQPRPEPQVDGPSDGGTSGANPTATSSGTALPAASSSGSSAAASATASSPKKSPLAPPADPNQCFADTQMPGTFGDPPPRLSDSCKIEEGHGAALVVKSQVVRAGGRSQNGVSDAMTEWSRLGWYETAAYAMMRGHCCPQAKPLVGPKRMRSCKFEEALAAIQTSLDDPKAMDEAIEGYTRSVKCIASAGGAFSFQQWGPPYGGETVIVKKIYKRIAKLRGVK